MIRGQVGQGHPGIRRHVRHVRRGHARQNDRGDDAAVGDLIPPVGQPRGKAAGARTKERFGLVPRHPSGILRREAAGHALLDDQTKIGHVRNVQPESHVEGGSIPPGLRHAFKKIPGHLLAVGAGQPDFPANPFVQIHGQTVQRPGVSLDEPGGRIQRTCLDHGHALVREIVTRGGQHILGVQERRAHQREQDYNKQPLTHGIASLFWRDPVTACSLRAAGLEIEPDTEEQKSVRRFHDTGRTQQSTRFVSATFRHDTPHRSPDDPDRRANARKRTPTRNRRQGSLFFGFRAKKRRPEEPGPYRASGQKEPRSITEHGPRGRGTRLPDGGPGGKFHAIAERSGFDCKSRTTGFNSARPRHSYLARCVSRDTGFVPAPSRKRP